MEVPSNSALVTNTTLVESARLLDGSLQDYDGSGRSVRALFECCNLIECLVLNQEVFTLPADLPADTAGLPLITELRKAGLLGAVLSQEDARSAVDAAKGLLGPIGNDRIYSMAVGDKLFTNDNPHLRDHKEPLEDDEIGGLDYLFQLHSIDYSRKVTSSLAAHDPYLKIELQGREKRKAPKSMAEYLDVMRGELNWRASPNSSYVVHQIRNVVYWSIAETCGLSYSPDATRVDWLGAWNKRWRASIGETVYKIVADAFGAKVSEVRADNEEQCILLPPIPAMVASRASSPGDLVKIIFEVRDEFAEFRHKLHEMMEEKRHARTIAERVRAANRLRNLYASVSAKASKPAGATLSSAVGYSGKLLGIVEDPLSLKAYAGLAERGADWVQSWWNSRPASRLLSLQRRVESLGDYWALAQRLMPGGIAEKDVKAFDNYHQVYWAYRRSSPSPVKS